MSRSEAFKRFQELLRVRKTETDVVKLDMIDAELDLLLDDMKPEEVKQATVVRTSRSICFEDVT